MAITTEYIKKYARGVLPKEEETLFYQSLLSVANFVIIRHFNNLSEEDRNDARSEAVTGALKALKKPFVDFTSFDALHYTYTTMRHSIHNYFRKYKDKEIATDPEMFDFMIENTHNPCFLFTQLLERIHKYYKSECCFSHFYFISISILFFSFVVSSFIGFLSLSLNVFFINIHIIHIIFIINHNINNIIILSQIKKGNGINHPIKNPKVIGINNIINIIIVKILSQKNI